MESAPVKMAIYLRTAASVLQTITKTKMINAYVSHAINLFLDSYLRSIPTCEDVINPGYKYIY